MIQEQTNRNIKNSFKDIIKKAAKTTEDLSILLNSLLATNIKENRINKLTKFGGEGNSNSLEKMREKGKQLFNFKVADEDIDDFKRLLKQNKAYYVLINQKKDNTKLFVFLEEHRDRIEAAQEILKAERKIQNQISLSSFISNYDKQRVYIIDNLTEIDYEVFKEKAKEHRLIYSFSKEDNNYSIYHDLKDKEKVDKIIFELASELTQRHIKIKQIEDKIQNKKVINETLKNESETIYIVSAINSNNYIKLTKEDFSYYKGDNLLKSLNKHDNNFTDELNLKISALSDYIILNNKEFLSEKERNEIIERKSSIYSEKNEAIDINKLTDLQKEEINEYANKFNKKIEVVVKDRTVLDKKIEEAKARINKMQTNKKEKEKEKEM